jgi:predicted MFS family arabinose efflux permease
MQFTDEVKWDETDFLAIGAVLAAAGSVVEVGARVSGHFAHRLGMFVAVVTGVLLIWINLAVGIFGNEEHPANLLFFSVLAAAGAGTWAAKFQPAGMARALQATTGVQFWMGLMIATGGPAGGPMADRVKPLVLIGAFTLQWLVAALLFGKAARAGEGAQRRG